METGDAVDQMATVSSKLLRGCVAAILLALLGLLVFQLLRPAKLPLTIVSFDPQMRISARCTVGTNHAYHIGGLWGWDPFPRKETTVPQGDANFLRCSTDEQSTVIWVRFDHPGFGVASSPRVIGSGRRRTELFRAQLTRSNGETVALAQIGTSIKTSGTGIL